MKKPSTFLVTLCGLVTISASGLFVISCHDEATVEIPEKNEISAASFMANLDANLNSFMDVAIDANKAQHSRVSATFNPPKDSTTLIFIEHPMPEAIPILTPRRLLEHVDSTGTELSLINDGTFEDSILVSNAACMEALNPLILDSKNYLYGKGFTETEIQEMLAEENAEESDLVPFVMALAEEEEYQANHPEEYEPNSRGDIDWKRAGRCAFETIGGDILDELFKHPAKSWGKPLLKRVFKKVATKMLGPVGAVVAVVDFSMCYWGED